MIKYFFSAHKPFLSLLLSLFLISFILISVSHCEIKTPFPFSGVRSHSRLEDIYTFALFFFFKCDHCIISPSRGPGGCVWMQEEAHAPNPFMSEQMCDNNFLKEADRETLGALLIRAASRGSPQPCQLFSDFKAFSLATEHPFPILGERLCWNLSWISDFLLKSLKGAAQGSAFQSCLSSHADPFSSLQIAIGAAASLAQPRTPRCPRDTVISL